MEWGTRPNPEDTPALLVDGDLSKDRHPRIKEERTSHQQENTLTSMNAIVDHNAEAVLSQALWNKNDPPSRNPVIHRRDQKQENRNLYRIHYGSGSGYWFHRSPAEGELQARPLRFIGQVDNLHRGLYLITSWASGSRPIFWPIRYVYTSASKQKNQNTLSLGTEIDSIPDPAGTGSISLYPISRLLPIQRNGLGHAGIPLDCDKGGGRSLSLTCMSSKYTVLRICTSRNSAPEKKTA